MRFRIMDCVFIAFGFVFAVSFLPPDAKDMMNAHMRFFFLEDK